MYLFNFTKLLTLLSIVNYNAGLFEVDLTGGNSLVCNETKFISFDKLRVKKVSHTEYLVDGEINVFVELGNEFQVCSFALKLFRPRQSVFHQLILQAQTLIYKKAGNAYQMTAFHLGPHKFCDYLQKDSLSYDDLVASSDLPDKSICPWPKGTYTISGFQVPMHAIPSHFEGDYMYELRVLLNDEMVNGYQVYLTIISV